MSRIEGIILDWAGTTVDFGCFAPVNVFLEVFRNAGIEATMEEARAPMGMLKIDHIRAMLAMPRIAALWEAEFGRACDEQDVERLYAEFEPALLASLSQYTDPLPEAVETVRTLREQGLKIGSTTGYTRSMMEVVVPNAAAKGYQPDYVITPDDTNSFGRPYPYMIYRNMEVLQLSAASRVVKVGDTVSDIKEGVNAGVWSVGVIIGSSEMGLSENEFNALPPAGKEAAIARVAQVFQSQGAAFTIQTLGELPGLIRSINTQLAQGKRPNAG